MFYSHVLRVVRVVCVLRVGVGFRVLKVLRCGGGEGRIPSLMAGAIASEVPSPIPFHSSLMCHPLGIRHKQERSEPSC
jgi:hypothetical protein